MSKIYHVEKKVSKNAKMMLEMFKTKRKLMSKIYHMEKKVSQTLKIIVLYLSKTKRRQ